MGDNLTELILQNETFLEFLSPEVIANISGLVTILKTVGIIAIIYIGFLIVSTILNFKKTKLIKQTHDKVEELEKKLDKLLEKNSKK
jgi:hypothetical protein